MDERVDERRVSIAINGIGPEETTFRCGGCYLSVFDKLYPSGEISLVRDVIPGVSLRIHKLDQFPRDCAGGVGINLRFDSSQEVNIEGMVELPLTDEEIENQKWFNLLILSEEIGEVVGGIKIGSSEIEIRLALR